MVNDISNKAVMTIPLSPPSNVVDISSATLKNDQNSEIEDVDISKEELANRQTTTEKMQETASRLNEITQKIQRNLEFSVNEDSGDVVISVVDRETNEVIRQIPEEHVLAIRENIESLKGILISAKI